MRMLKTGDKVICRCEQLPHIDNFIPRDLWVNAVIMKLSDNGQRALVSIDKPNNENSVTYHGSIANFGTIPTHRIYKPE